MWSKGSLMGERQLIVPAFCDAFIGCIPSLRFNTQKRSPTISHKNRFTPPKTLPTPTTRYGVRSSRIRTASPPLRPSWRMVRNHFVFRCICVGLRPIPWVCGFNLRILSLCSSFRSVSGALFHGFDFFRRYTPCRMHSEYSLSLGLYPDFFSISSVFRLIGHYSLWSMP